MDTQPASGVPRRKKHMDISLVIQHPSDHKEDDEVRITDEPLQLSIDWSSISNNRKSIFDVDLPECINPKGKEFVHKKTGEITFTPFGKEDADGVFHYLGCGSSSCFKCTVIKMSRVP